MSVPANVKGDYFSVAVSLDGGSTYTAICGLTSRNLTRALQTNDEYIKDCADPQSIPFRIINATGQSYDIAGTGIYDRNQTDLIDSLFGRSLPYRYFRADDADSHVSSSYAQGNFVLTNVQTGAQDGNSVTSQMSFASDGEVRIVPASPVIDLDALGMTPKTVVHAVPYSGTVTGTTTGSTLTATSSDATTLTVSGTGNTRTVAGTFAAAGFPNITLTETLAGAANTPKQTILALTVT
jgi:hypothetical protein